MKFFNSFRYMGLNTTDLSTWTLVLVRKGSTCNRKFVFSLKLIFFAYLQGAITTTKNFRKKFTSLSLSLTLLSLFLSLFSPCHGHAREFSLVCKKTLFSTSLSLSLAFSLLSPPSFCLLSSSLFLSLLSSLCPLLSLFRS